MKSDYCINFETRLTPEKVIEVKNCRGKLFHPIDLSMTLLENSERAVEKAIRELYHCEPPEKCFRITKKNGEWVFIMELPLTEGLFRRIGKAK